MKEIFDKPKIKILHIQLLPLLSGVQNVMIDIMENASPDQFEFSVISAPHGPLIMKLKNMDLKHYPLPGLIREINLYDIIIFLKFIRSAVVVDLILCIHTLPKQVSLVESLQE